MSGYFQKTADETIECRVDWSEGYLDPGEAVIRDLGWQVAARPGQGGAQARLFGARHDRRSSSVRVGRGVRGTVCMLVARAATSAGRTLDRAVVLRVV